MGKDSILTILQSWGNVIFVNPTIEKEAERKLLICNTCSHREGYKCGACGCPLIAKTRGKSTCPKDKW
jgi:hypothetical protein